MINKSAILERLDLIQAYLKELENLIKACKKKESLMKNWVKSFFKWPAIGIAWKLCRGKSSAIFWTKTMLEICFSLLHLPLKFSPIQVPQHQDRSYTTR
ncbi:MAG: hypothetical protein PWR06_286 [Thermoanaerobacteraceae bacterium]|nr:hypothetical protein [Thermoanaerobacteraceae bacterium]